MSKKSLAQGTAVWINSIGLIQHRTFSVLKEENNILTISFSKDEVYEIDKSNVRARKILVYQKSNGEIIIQNPNKISLINLNKKNVKTLRFNLQNTSLQESKAAIYRWTLPKDIVDKLGPIFKLLFICIAVAVIGWAAFKFGGHALDLVTSARTLDCNSLLQTAASDVPIGVTP
jgi:hypothetical protein